MSTEPTPTGPIRTKINWGPVLALAFGGAIALMLLFAGGGVGVNSLKGKELPAIHTNAQATWLNVDSPLSWEKLKGKVVWLEFGFLH